MARRDDPKLPPFRAQLALLVAEAPERPVLVCEVTFTEWTSDGKIRHPSFQGLREDKRAGQVVRERAAASPPSTRT